MHYLTYLHFMVRRVEIYSLRNFQIYYIVLFIIVSVLQIYLFNLFAPIFPQSPQTSGLLVTNMIVWVRLFRKMQFLATLKKCVCIFHITFSGVTLNANVFTGQNFPMCFQSTYICVNTNLQAHIHEFMF